MSTTESKKFSAEDVISGYAGVNPEDVVLPESNRAFDFSKEDPDETPFVHHQESDDEDDTSQKKRRSKRAGKKNRQTVEERLVDIDTEVDVQNTTVDLWIEKYQNEEVSLDKLIEKLRLTSGVIRRLKNTRSQLAPP